MIRRRFVSLGGRSISAASEAYREIEAAVGRLYRTAGLPAPGGQPLGGDLRDPSPWVRLSTLLRTPALRTAYDVDLSRVPLLRPKGLVFDQDHVIHLRRQLGAYDRPGSTTLQDLVASDEGTRYLCPWISLNPATGYMEIAYWAEDLSGANDGKARVCFCAHDGSSWGQPETVDPVYRTVTNCRGIIHSLQLVHESDGTPHICYFDQDAGTVRHAYKDGAWTSSAIEDITGLDPGLPDVGLAVDGGDDLGLVYYKPDGDVVYCCYASCDTSAGTWTTDGGPEGQVGQLSGVGSCFVGFQGVGDPVVCWGGANTSPPSWAKYASYDAGWQAEDVVDYALRAFGCAGSLALAAYGRDGATPASLCARRGPGTWTDDGDIWDADVWNNHVSNMCTWGGGSAAVVVQLGAVASVRRRDAPADWNELARLSAGPWLHPRSVARSSNGDLYIAFDNRFKLWCRRVLHD